MKPEVLEFSKYSQLSFAHTESSSSSDSLKPEKKSFISGPDRAVCHATPGLGSRRSEVLHSYCKGGFLPGMETSP